MYGLCLPGRFRGLKARMGNGGDQESQIAKSSKAQGVIGVRQRALQVVY